MKFWPTRLLGELIVIEKGKKALILFPARTKTRVRYLQIEDLRPNANVKYCEPFDCPKVTKADAIIAWDGANAGTVSCNLEGYIGSTLAALRPREILSAKFLSRFLEGHFDYLQQTANGATVPHISKDALASLKIPVPPLAEQERIVNLLDEADQLCKLRTQADHRTAEFIPALFHEMFSHTNRYRKVPISEIAEVQGGLQLTPKREKYPLKYSYLRVANVQRGFLALEEIKEIGLSESEYERTKLDKGDVLLVEGNGNPKEVGRAAIWDGSIGDCVHQNHLIRVRPNEDLLTSDYLLAFLNSQSGKNFFYGSGNTTSGLSTITTSIVKNCKIPLPPVALQKIFAERVREIRELETAQAQSRARLEALFQSLLHRAFKGEL